MTSTVNDQFVVNNAAACVYMARIAGNDGGDISAAAIASITRTITDTTTGAVSTTSLVVADSVFDDLKTDDPRWGLAGGAAEGFNFLDAVPPGAVPYRRRYTLQYTFTPHVGDVFKTREVDLIGD